MLFCIQNARRTSSSDKLDSHTFYFHSFKNPFTELWFISSHSFNRDRIKRNRIIIQKIFVMFHLFQFKTVAYMKKHVAFVELVFSDSFLIYLTNERKFVWLNGIKSKKYWNNNYFYFIVKQNNKIWHTSILLRDFKQKKRKTCHKGKFYAGFRKNSMKKLESFTINIVQLVILNHNSEYNFDLICIRNRPQKSIILSEQMNFINRMNELRERSQWTKLVNL